MEDLLIHNALIVTANPAFEVIPRGFVSARKERLTSVAAQVKGRALPPAREVIDAGGGIVLPGLVNAHTHLPMAMYRGLADDLPLMEWLEDHIFPAEARFATPENIAWATRLSCAEMLLGGVTTCCDGYFEADAVAAAAAEMGLRAVVGQGVVDFPAPGVPDPAGNVAAAEGFVRRWQGRSPLITPAIFCHSPYTCGAATLKAAKAAARQAGVLFQIHLAETREETARLTRAEGCSPAAYLARLGVLDRQTLAVHGVWLNEADIRLLADSGAALAHCPESNMKLGAGIAPLAAMRAAGVRLALGTDGCASNNDQDLLREMDTAAKLHKVRSGDPTSFDAATVLRMATSQGAEAIGLGAAIGSLEAGKQADLIVLDPRHPALNPCYNPVSQVVYAAAGDAVQHTVVAGRLRVRNRRPVDWSLPPILEAVNAIARDIAAARPPAARGR
jgi:5-methylthioadenosine/S-adenosylhomocysteine deaminase